MKVFLSYASEDRELAHKVAEDLRGVGHDVYPTSRWPQEIGAALQRADVFVVLLSPSALESPFVNQEIELALTSERFENRLIPVLLKPSVQIPWILKTMRPVKAASKPSVLAKVIDHRLKEADSLAR